jgi:alpha-D-xyloside xylohydrolase
MKILLLMIILTKVWWGDNLFSMGYTKTSQGIKTTINSVNVEIKFFTPDIVRITKVPGNSILIKNSATVIKDPENVPFSIRQKNNRLTVESKNLQLNIDTKTGVISFLDKSSKLLLTEKEFGSVFNPRKDNDRNTFSVVQEYKLNPGEAIYGLGQNQKGIMNHRNTKVTLRQDNMHISIPFMQSTTGYGIYWDNYSTTTFQDTLNVASFESDFGDCIDYYFIKGESADKVVAGMRILTGNVPMFPRWALGYFQSKERYKNQYEIVCVLKKYRELKVPIDCMVQDWQYWGGSLPQWNSTEFDKKLFPNPKAMIDSVHALNARLIISVWPSFGDQTKIYNELNSQDLLLELKTWPFQNVKVYDAFNPKARDIFWKYMNKNIFSLGMDGWWLDATEPEQFPYGQTCKTALGSFQTLRNLYPYVSIRDIYENQRKTTESKRVFLLTRSAFAGQQHYGSTNWSGDIYATWKVLRNQISGGLNLSLSAIPYWNTDIGGFFSGQASSTLALPDSKLYPKGVEDKAYRELYVRWLEFASFTPMFRSHGTNTPREIFRFGAKGDWSYDAIEKFINLRYRFLPYNYSTAWSVTSENSTMMRALVMDFANDKKVLDINNQYMFGKSILVCPVTEPLYVNRTNDTTSVENFSQTKSVQLYLPQGTKWVDFWSGKEFDGGQSIERIVPIDLMPLFIKAGTILPMGPFQQYSGEKNADNLEIRIYKGANGEFTLYEDENDNYHYEKGIYSVIRFSWDDANKILTIARRHGDFPGMLVTRNFNIAFVSEQNGTGMKEPKLFKTVKYTGKEIVIKE